jgi:hypothetical protein
MDRNGGDATVWVLQPSVASFCPDNYEANLAKIFDKLFAGY